MTAFAASSFVHMHVASGVILIVVIALLLLLAESCAALDPKLGFACFASVQHSERRIVVGDRVQLRVRAGVVKPPVIEVGLPPLSDIRQSRCITGCCTLFDCALLRFRSG